MKKNYTLILFIVFCLSCLPQNKVTYSEVYNLNLRNLADTSIAYQWRMNVRYYTNPYTFFSAVGNDPIAILYHGSDFSKEDRLQSEISQRILMPIHRESEGMVKLAYQTKNIESAYMVINGIDKQEYMLYSDTLHLLPDSNIVTLSKKINLQQVELMDLKLFVHGVKSENAEPRYPKLEVSKLDVFVGNKHLDHYPVRELSFPFPAAKNLVIPVNDNDCSGFEQVEVLKSKKIVGLGESIHHNKCIGDMVSRLIMHQVKNGDCKVIIIEQPMETVLHFNHYIQDREATTALVNVNKTSLKDLLEQLRAYNLAQETEERVLLFGMDFVYQQNASDNSAFTLFDYITARNKNNKIRILDEFSLLLANYSDQAAILSFIEDNRSLLEEHLSVKDYQCISHILTLSYGLGKTIPERKYLRDSVMYLNTRFIIDNFCPPDKQVILYGHAGHLNPVSTYPLVPCDPLGYYLKKWYQDKYSSLLFTLGSGFNESIGITAVLEEKELMPPPKGSIENYLNSFNTNAVYLPLNENFNNIVLSRSKGNRHDSQEFFPYNLFQRHAGLFFIKECTEKTGKEDVAKLKNELEKMYQGKDTDPDEMDRLFKKIYGEINIREKEREKLVLEIKERLGKK